MLITAAVLFAIAAAGGATMAVMHFRGRTPPPIPLALAHGLLAAAALVVLILALLKTGFAGLGALALVIFLIAALGGFYLFSLHLRKKPLPSPVILIHGGAAVAAFVILLVQLLGATA